MPTDPQRHTPRVASSLATGCLIALAIELVAAIVILAIGVTLIR